MLPRFPYANKNPDEHAALLNTLFTLIWNQDQTSTPIGYLPETVLLELVQVPIAIRGEVTINQQNRTVSAFQLPTVKERSSAVAATTKYWRANKTFQVLSGWRDELFPVYGPENELLYNIERSASALLGVVTYGVHMTAYIRCADASHGIKIWVPRRAATKQTYAGMLDNTVAGGTASGEDPFECLVRECEEEASLPEEIVRQRVVAHGSISYIYIRDSRAGGERGLIQPEVEHVYDLELPQDWVVKPNDFEVQEFYLWTVEEVQDHLARGDFKPNCGAVMLDFFIRLGILTTENESDFEEIKRRLHRDLEFPGPYRV